MTAAAAGPIWSGLTRLLADIAARRVDCVVVYKVDRLSRSLLDFARMMEVFERHSATFVSVTQQFNTATSLGRLTLNIVLSFAQFEREIIGERTRDKQAAARRRGQWTGGCLALGYDLDPAGARLRVNETEAEQVRAIFRLFVEHGALAPTVEELTRRGWTTKSWRTRVGTLHRGGPFRADSLARLLRNCLYIGRVRLGAEHYPGEQSGIVDRALWEQAQQLLASAAPTRQKSAGRRTLGAFCGRLWCAGCGSFMKNAWSGRWRHRYYVCAPAAEERGRRGGRCSSLPADDLERIAGEAVGTVAGAEPNVCAHIERITWMADSARLIVHLHDQREVSVEIRRMRGRHGRIALRRADEEPHAPAITAAGRVPPISRLLALALRLSETGQSGETGDYAAVARSGGVTMARVRQIINLLNLAPDIQERLLFLPPIHGGRDPITERELSAATDLTAYGPKMRPCARQGTCRAFADFRIFLCSTQSDIVNRRRRDVRNNIDVNWATASPAGELRPFSNRSSFWTIRPKPVLLGHPYHQGFDFIRLARTTGFSFGASVVLLRDQSSMPSQQRVGSDDRRHVPEDAPSEALRFRRQATTLLIVESQPPFAQLFTQNAVLLPQVIDRVQMALVHPTRDGHEKEPEGIKESRHGKNTLSLPERKHTGMSQIRLSDHTRSGAT
jgi:DNA invertase Pin-like site-specific DNA recombinase